MIGPKVSIGTYTMIGPNVSIVGGDHKFDVPGIPIIFAGRPELPETLIESDVWVGCGSIIIAGCRIGRGAIVAAGAVVTKDVPPYTIVAGVPAKVIKNRFESRDFEARHDAMLQSPALPGKYCEPLL